MRLEKILTFYLDQSTLSNLASGKIERRHADDFLRAIESHRISAVLSFGHIYETWKYQDGSGRKRIADFADSLPEIGWIINHFNVSKGEIRKAFFGFCGFEVPAFNPLRKRLKDTFYEDESGPLLIIVDEISFGSMLSIIDRNPKSIEGFQEWTRLGEAFPPAVKVANRAFARRGRKAVNASVLEVIAKDVREKLPHHFPDSTIVPISKKDEFISSKVWLRYSSAPYTSLHTKIIQDFGPDATVPIEASQMLDLAHLAALPYVDVFFCDRRTRQFVNRAKAPAEMVAKCFIHLEDALSYAIRD